MADQSDVPTVEPQAGSTVITRAQVLCWPLHDCRTKGNAAIPDWQFLTWAKHDIIRVNGL
jgi:hypothetical protein